MYQAHSEQHLGQSNSSSQALLIQKKFPVAIPVECLSPTPFPANSSIGLIHKCLNLWIFLTMSEFPDPEQDWHLAQPEWEAGMLQHRGHETTGQKWEHCSATANHYISWNGLNKALAITEEPRRQNPKKSFPG